MTGVREVRLSFASIGRALAAGRAVAARAGRVGTGYAAIFTFLGAIILWLLVRTGMTPFVIAAAGAFMLVGPIVLTGFFGIVHAVETGGAANADAVFEGFHRPPAAIWVIALVCMLLFMIFVTDAGILYSYMVGGTPLFPADMLPPPENAVTFIFWTAFSGIVVALLLFTVSAFSIPLLFEHRASLVSAVVASARVVFRNFATTMAWAALLSVTVMGSILLLPLLPFVLPVMAYASHALYREALPFDP